MGKRRLLVATIWGVVAILFFVPCCTFAGDFQELTDTELDGVYAGNNTNDGEWVEFEINTAEPLPPFVMMGDVTISDNAMQNLRSLVNVQAAGSIVQISVNLALIRVENSSTGPITVDMSDISHSINLNSFLSGLQ
jgi:hypothetical protein